MIALYSAATSGAVATVAVEYEYHNNSFIWFWPQFTRKPSPVSLTWIARRDRNSGGSVRRIIDTASKTSFDKQSLCGRKINVSCVVLDQSAHLC